MARERSATALDRARVDALARYLACGCTCRSTTRSRYRRAIRDLVGHGEGIFGIIDGYPAEVAGTTPDRLARDRAQVRRLAVAAAPSTRAGSCARTVTSTRSTSCSATAPGSPCLDASRGACGDPADDVTAMAINYVLFALDAPGAWRDGLGVLWRELWGVYTRERADPSLRGVRAAVLRVAGARRVQPALLPGAERARAPRAARASRKARSTRGTSIRPGPTSCSRDRRGRRRRVVHRAPASGKTTLARRVRERIAPRRSCVLLDSDEVRAAIGADRYGLGDRDAFYRMLAGLAALLARQGHVVLVAATAPRRVHREAARAAAPALRRGLGPHAARRVRGRATRRGSTRARGGARHRTCPGWARPTSRRRRRTWSPTAGSTTPRSPRSSVGSREPEGTGTSPV